MVEQMSLIHPPLLNRTVRPACRRPHCQANAVAPRRSPSFIFADGTGDDQRYCRCGKGCVAEARSHADAEQDRASRAV
jgi:hypothetical protein